MDVDLGRLRTLLDLLGGSSLWNEEYGMSSLPLLSLASSMLRSNRLPPALSISAVHAHRRLQSDRRSFRQLYPRAGSVDSYVDTRQQPGQPSILDLPIQTVY
jgi:hypothetical protein